MEQNYFSPKGCNILSCLNIDYDYDIRVFCICSYQIFILKKLKEHI